MSNLKKINEIVIDKRIVGGRLFFGCYWLNAADPRASKSYEEKMTNWRKTNSQKKTFSCPAADKTCYLHSNEYIRSHTVQIRTAADRRL